MNDIEILEELRHELGLYANGEKVRQGQAIANLIQRNKDLEQIEKEHKEVVREKIKKLDKEYKEALEENSTKAFILKCQLTILQELLEESEK